MKKFLNSEEAAEEEGYFDDSSNYDDEEDEGESSNEVAAGDTNDRESLFEYDLDNSPISERERERIEIQREIATFGLVSFEKNSSYMSDQAKVSLVKLANYLNANPRLIIKVEAHADSRGTESYNYWITERRVARIKSALIKYGVSSDRIDTEGSR